jgi:hypothetical protein
VRAADALIQGCCRIARNERVLERDEAPSADNIKAQLRACFVSAEAVAFAISVSLARPMRCGRQDGQTTGLCQAANYGHRDVIRLLLEHAADVNAADTVHARSIMRGGSGDGVLRRNLQARKRLKQCWRKRYEAEGERGRQDGGVGVVLVVGTACRAPARTVRRVDGRVRLVGAPVSRCLRMGAATCA